MSRVAYVNGAYSPHGQAVVHIEDRGFQFADGVYEVWSVMDGRLADFDGHMARLNRSLDALKIEIPMTAAALGLVLRETVRRNRVREGMVYLQVTRGTAARDHAFPTDAAPSVIVTAKSVDRARGQAMAAKGAAGVTQPDIRWGRCDIKTVGLLPNVLAKQAARERGAYECLMYDDMGLVTEGASTNAWIVDEDGRLRTRDTQANIFAGDHARGGPETGRGRGYRAGRTPLLGRGGQAGARGLRHRRQRLRHAADLAGRREDRRRQAGPGRHTSARRLS